MKRLALLLLLLPFLGFSQGQANNWYFGNNAGVTFNTAPPSTLFDGQLQTNEGCSAISDINGNLLFYTDGRTIWNRQHQVMPNANYFGNTGLHGDPSSTSSGLIVPHPGNPNQYFVFTVDEPHHDNAAFYPNQYFGAYSDGSGYVPGADDGYNNGFNYSIVDMTLKNGMGDVLTGERNNPLITYDPSDSEEIKYKCSEKITAVKGVDCSSIWVLTHFVDKFYTFKVDVNGVDPNPVVSTIGPVIPVSSYRRGAIGYMKISPDGEKLLVAHQTKNFNQMTGEQSQSGGVYLYDFNNTTGQVGNEIILVENVNAYGVEFSSKSTKAYATVEKEGNAHLYQWDLDAADIPASLFSFQNAMVTSSALQLAPNGKIYLSILSDAKLAAINHPELQGAAADYTTDISNGAISLGGRQAAFGLPPFIQSIFSESINIVDNSDKIKTELKLCDGESYTLGYDNIPNATYTWYKNEVSIPGQTTSSLTISQDPNKTLPYAVNYRLEVDLNDGSCPLKGIANVVYYPRPEVADVVYEQCLFDSGTTAFFNLDSIIPEIINGGNVADFTFGFYPSLADAQNGTNEITTTDSYQNTQNNEILTVRVEDVESGCPSFADVELVVNPGTNAFPPIELVSCDPEMDGFGLFDLTQVIPQIQSGNPNIEVVFYANLQDTYTETNPIQNPSQYQANDQNGQTLVYARAELFGACKGIYGLSLVVDSYPPIGKDLTGSNSLVYCLGDYPEKIILDSGIPVENENEYTFLWQPSGETTPTIGVNMQGEYSVSVTNIASGCTATRNFNLVYSNIADFALDIGIANTLSVVLSPHSIGDYEYSLDNISGPYQDSRLFESVAPGLHTVYARDKNGCGISRQQGTVYGIMKFFTPNQDGVNDKWTYFLDVDNFKNTKLYIYDRYGKMLHADSGNSQFWDGTYNGKEMPSDDYWYHIIMENGQVLRGHFSLIR